MNPDKYLELTTSRSSMGHKNFRDIICEPASRQITSANKRVIAILSESVPNFSGTNVYTSVGELSGCQSLESLALVRYGDNKHNIILNKKCGEECAEFSRFTYVNQPESKWNTISKSQKALPLPIYRKMLSKVGLVDPLREKFYEQIIAHEYGHLQDDKLKTPLKEIEKEPFAFWFSEVVSGHTSLFLSYENHYGSAFDEMFKYYEKLHRNFDSLSPSEALKNAFK